MSRKDLRSTLDAACNAANGIENPGARVVITARIAVLQHRAGNAPDYARALSTALGEARQIEDAGMRTLALARIAHARARTGERRSWREPSMAALTSVARLPADRAEVCALREVAMAHAAAGEFAEAAALTDRFADRQDRDRTLDALVDRYNHRRYHESVGNLTPADIYFGRHHAIIERTKKFKELTICKISRHLTAIPTVLDRSSYDI